MPALQETYKSDAQTAERPARSKPKAADQPGVPHQWWSERQGPLLSGPGTYNSSTAPHPRLACHAQRFTQSVCQALLSEQAIPGMIRLRCRRRIWSAVRQQVGPAADCIVEYSKHNSSGGGPHFCGSRRTQWWRVPLKVNIRPAASVYVRTQRNPARPELVITAMRLDTGVREELTLSWASGEHPGPWGWVAPRHHQAHRLRGELKGAASGMAFHWFAHL
jgi:hypothetical protein